MKVIIAILDKNSWHNCFNFLGIDLSVVYFLVVFGFFSQTKCTSNIFHIFFSYKKIWEGYLVKNLKLKVCVYYFLSNFYFCQMIVLQSLWKLFLISSKRLFSFSRHSSFCIFVFPAFFSVSLCFRGWYIINCLNKNLITFCLISWERNKVWHWSFVHW